MLAAGTTLHIMQCRCNRGLMQCRGHRGSMPWDGALLNIRLAGHACRMAQHAGEGQRTALGLTQYFLGAVVLTCMCTRCFSCKVCKTTAHSCHKARNMVQHTPVQITLYKCTLHQERMSDVTTLPVCVQV